MGLTVWQLWNSLIGSVCVHILCHQLQPCCWHKQKRLSLQWCWKSASQLHIFYLNYELDENVLSIYSIIPRADCRNGEGVVIGVKLYGVTCILKTKSFPASSLRHSRSSWPPPPFTLQYVRGVLSDCHICKQWTNDAQKNNKPHQEPEKLHLSW